MYIWYIINSYRYKYYKQDTRKDVSYYDFFREEETKDINLINGNIVEGECVEFTNFLDNDPEISSMTIKNEGGLIEIYAIEIKKINNII